MKTKNIFFSLYSVVALAGFATADANAASIRITCEKGADYSKISVDGRELAPGANYRAGVRSGSNRKASGFQQADINGENEFDFSSKANDINAGATSIPAGFITGNPPSVNGRIVDSANFTVASDINVPCTVK